MTVSDSAMPEWLIVVAWISLALGILCSLLITADIVRRPQPMKVMNVVWPICALFGSVLWLAGYLWWGRADLPDGHAGSPAPAVAPGMDSPGHMKDMAGMQDKAGWAPWRGWRAWRG